MQQLIIWPMIILALATLALYFPMSKARIKMVREKKIPATTFKLNQGEPEESLVYVNAIANQFETPVLFYAVCLAAYVTQNTGWLMVILAWAYLIAKLAHIYVHVTSNNLRLRRPIFMVSYAVLVVMWVALAVELLVY